MGAHGSVSALLDALTLVRDTNMQAAGKNRGRYTNDEIDLLRAALVFTSSGLDASLHRLVRDALPDLARRSGSGARPNYQTFIKQESSNPSKEFCAALLAEDPTSELLKVYVTVRTRASYQGSGDLRARVRTALGIRKTAVPDADLAALDPFFEARNAIVHGMDYVDPENSSGRKREARSRSTTIAECDKVFNVAATLIHETAKLLRHK